MLRFEVCCKKKWPSNGIVCIQMCGCGGLVNDFNVSIQFGCVFVGIKIYSSNFIYVHDYTSPKSYLILSQDVFVTCPSNFIIWSPSARRWLVRIIWKGSLEHKSNQNRTMYSYDNNIDTTSYIQFIQNWSIQFIQNWSMNPLTHHCEKRKAPWKIRKAFNHEHSRTFFPVLYGDLSSRRQSWANPKDEKTNWNSSLWSCKWKWIRYFQTSSCQRQKKYKNRCESPPFV